ncbi:RES family NAD+ phosphorylase [Bdellovibrionota bacterium FG-1]
MQSYRIVEHQNRIYEFNATSTDTRAELLQSLLERTKPEPYYHEWHELIATQFRYPVPVGVNYAARFRPPGSLKNVFYSSQEIETTLYEHAYHFLKFRLGMKKLAKTSQRTLVSVHFTAHAPIMDLSQHSNIKAITNPKSYEASHAYVATHPETKVIQYPSCRDPQRRPNFATRDITCLQKTIEHSQTISLAYQKKTHSIHWIENNVTISWSQFALTEPPRSHAPT